MTLALLAVGEFIGLPKPDAFAFDYDVKNNEIVSARFVDGIIADSRPRG